MQQFVVPPGWPTPPPGWVPPAGWNPDPAWPPAPDGWVFWREVDAPVPAVGAAEPGAGFVPVAHRPAAPVSDLFPRGTGPTLAPPAGPPLPYAGAPSYPTPAPGAWSAAPATPVVDNTFAWILAVAPLSLILVTFALRGLGQTIADVLFVLTSLVLYLSLAIADSRKLARAGVSVSPLWVLLPLVYMILRTARARQTWWIVAVYAVSGLTLGFTSVYVDETRDVEYEALYLERELSAQYATEFDTTVVPECPDPAAAPVGGEIECHVTYVTGEEVTVMIEVLNAQGDWTWYEVLP